MANPLTYKTYAQRLELKDIQSSLAPGSPTSPPVPDKVGMLRMSPLVHKPVVIPPFTYKYSKVVVSVLILLLVHFVVSTVIIIYCGTVYFNGTHITKSKTLSLEDKKVNLGKTGSVVLSEVMAPDDVTLWIGKSNKDVRIVGNVMISGVFNLGSSSSLYSDNLISSSGSNIKLQASSGVITAVDGNNNPAKIITGSVVSSVNRTSLLLGVSDDTTSVELVSGTTGLLRVRARTVRVSTPLLLETETGDITLSPQSSKLKVMANEFFVSGNAEISGGTVTVDNVVSSSNSTSLILLRGNTEVIRLDAERKKVYFNEPIVVSTLQHPSYGVTVPTSLYLNYNQTVIGSSFILDNSKGISMGSDSEFVLSTKNFGKTFMTLSPTEGSVIVDSSRKLRVAEIETFNTTNNRLVVSAKGLEASSLYSSSSNLVLGVLGLESAITLSGSGGVSVMSFSGTNSKLVVDIIDSTSGLTLPCTTHFQDTMTLDSGLGIVFGSVGELRSTSGALTMSIGGSEAFRAVNSGLIIPDGNELKVNRLKPVAGTSLDISSISSFTGGSSLAFNVSEKHVLTLTDKTAAVDNTLKVDNVYSNSDSQVLFRSHLQMEASTELYIRESAFFRMNMYPSNVAGCSSAAHIGRIALLHPSSDSNPKLCICDYDAEAPDDYDWYCVSMCRHPVTCSL